MNVGHSVCSIYVYCNIGPKDFPRGHLLIDFSKTIKTLKPLAVKRKPTRILINKNNNEF